MTLLMSLLIGMVGATIIVGICLLITFTVYTMYYILIKLVRFIL